MRVEVLNSFKKAFKTLAKKDKALITQYKKLIAEIKENPDKGTPLGNGIYKIRLRNSTNNKGKSAGYRVITYTKVKQTLVFVYIYSKSDVDTVSAKKIDECIRDYLQK